MQTGKTLSDPNRFKFDGDGYYLKSAAEMRSLWDDELPGACDSTLLIAERVQSYEDVWAPRDRMPVFPVPDGHDQGSWLRHEVDAGLARAVPGRGATRIRRASRLRDRGHLRQGLSVVLPDRRRPRRLRAVGGHPGRPRPRVGRRLARRLLAAHHRHRPDRARAAVRALPQSGTRVDARYRHRLRRPPPRRDGALRRRQVGPRPGRAGDHLRHHQNEGGAEGFGPNPLRPARFRDRRPDHQGAAACRHGQGHSAVGYHRPHPRPLQGSRRDPRPDRHRSRRPHHLRDRPRPRGPDPQRRRARLRGDHELRAADRGDPAVEAAAGRRHHHRLGLSVVRGHRPVEDGLPRPAEPDDHRRRAGEHPGQQGDRTRPGVVAARRRPHLRIARPRRHPRRVPARRRSDARPAAPHAAHRVRGRRRRDRAVPARPDGHERPQRLRRPQERPPGHPAHPPGAGRTARGDPGRDLRPDRLPRADHAHRAEGRRLLARPSRHSA